MEKGEKREKRRKRVLITAHAQTLIAGRLGKLDANMGISASNNFVLLQCDGSLFVPYLGSAERVLTRHA